MAQPAPTIADLDARLRAVEETLASSTVLLPGRPPKITECKLGNEPGKCDKASVHRYQTGCHGQDCYVKNATYYDKKRKEKKTADAPAVEPPAKPVRVRKKTVEPAAAAPAEAKPKRTRKKD